MSQAFLHDHAMPIKSTLNEVYTSTKVVARGLRGHQWKEDEKVNFLISIAFRPVMALLVHHHWSPVVFFFAPSDPYRAAGLMDRQAGNA